MEGFFSFVSGRYVQPEERENRQCCFPAFRQAPASLLERGTREGKGKKRQVSKRTSRSQPNHLIKPSLNPLRAILAQILLHRLPRDIFQPPDVHRSLERVVGHQRVELGVVLGEEVGAFTGVTVDFGGEGVGYGFDDTVRRRRGGGRREEGGGRVGKRSVRRRGGEEEKMEGRGRTNRSFPIE